MFFNIYNNVPCNNIKFFIDIINFVIYVSLIEVLELKLYVCVFQSYFIYKYK